MKGLQSAAGGARPKVLRLDGTSQDGSNTTLALIPCTATPIQADYCADRIAWINPGHLAGAVRWTMKLTPGRSIGQISSSRTSNGGNGSD